MLNAAAAAGPAVTLADVQAAAARIRGHVIDTPCLRSHALSERSAAKVWVKFENRQRTASFKERGALNFLLQLDGGSSRRGVVTMSAGNHAQAIACHARRLDIPAVVVMPVATPYVKVQQTGAHGAEIVLHGETLDAASGYAHRLARERGLTFVHPFDDAEVIAGQGTVALEMLQTEPLLEDLVVPIGGGGLAAGMAVAAKALRPGIRVTGVQSASFPAMAAAFRGEAVAARGSTIAEGIAVQVPGELTSRLVCDLVDDVLLVDERQLETAITQFLNDEKTVAEGAGAAGLAALTAAGERFRGRRVGLVVSGGNIDPNLLASVIVRDLVRQRRIVGLRMTMPDRPGFLARISQTIADLGANVLEVDHRRLSVALPARSATLELTFEARDARHGDDVVAALHREGFSPEILPP